MSILIGSYEFDGPYKNVADLEEKRGLYAVLHCEGEVYELVHVVQAENIRERIELLQSGYSQTAGTLLLAACYTPRARSRERCIMVEEIQREFNEQDNQDCDNFDLAKVAS